MDQKCEKNKTHKQTKNSCNNGVAWSKCTNKHVNKKKQIKVHKQNMCNNGVDGSKVHKLNKTHEQTENSCNNGSGWIKCVHKQTSQSQKQ